LYQGTTFVGAIKSHRRQDPLDFQATLFIICGLPGSGKTTLAKHIEGSLSAVRMSADDWMTTLSINLHAEEQRAKIEALQWELAKRLLSLQQNVVIEWGAWGKRRGMLFELRPAL
jgi:predicted kinase